MKALLIRQKVSSGLMDYIHGGGHMTNRLVLPEMEGLTITIYDGDISAFFGFSIGEAECEILGEVEIPGDLVSKAVVLATAKADMRQAKTKFERLLENK